MWKMVLYIGDDSKLNTHILGMVLDVNQNNVMWEIVHDVIRCYGKVKLAIFYVLDNFNISSEFISIYILGSTLYVQ